ncbi:MAG: c-type cytochrome [Proteobacteria bacterium]|nr:c-type cytochrome [Pseudomonadota bacterium]
MSFLLPFRRYGATACAVIVIGLLANMGVGNVYAQESTLAEQTLTQECIDQIYAGKMHQSNSADLALEIEKDCLFKNGREWYDRRCSFCHGGQGKGGKGPCLTCGKFSYSANSNMAILTTISVGITNKSLGGAMGAFGTTISGMDILSIVTYLRAEEIRRIASKEIKDPYIKEEVMVFPE